MHVIFWMVLSSTHVLKSTERQTEERISACMDLAAEAVDQYITYNL